MNPKRRKKQMARPTARIGDANSGGGVVMMGVPTVLTTGRPTAVVGVPISPHDNKPVHIAVAAMGNPLVCCNGIPTNRMGDLDSCGHVRIMGAATVLC